MRDLKKYLFDLQDADEVTVAMMIPFVKELYRNLIKIYYLGETRISNFFKDIYNDLAKYPKFDLKKAQLLSKTGITEWFYLYSQVIKGLYPLLMRMSSTKFDYFQDFFLTQTTSILSFLELTKFDLLLPNKKGEKQTEAKPEAKSPEEKKADEEEQKKKAEEESKKSDIVDAGLKLLDNLFPEAGFNHLEKMPDMFPYFQPLYQFRDGYNLRKSAPNHGHAPSYHRRYFSRLAQCGLHRRKRRRCLSGERKTFDGAGRVVGLSRNSF